MVDRQDHAAAGFCVWEKICGVLHTGGAGTKLSLGHFGGEAAGGIRAMAVEYTLLELGVG